MRRITTHKAGNDLTQMVDVFAVDKADHEKGGGACHRYMIGHCHEASGPSVGFRVTAEINFQHGPVKEYGVNGCSDEAILAVLIDRLECFQQGNLACNDNDATLDFLTQAMRVMHSRTADRITRGVEGKSKS